MFFSSVLAADLVLGHFSRISDPPIQVSSGPVLSEEDRPPTLELERNRPTSGGNLGGDFGTLRARWKLAHHMFRGVRE